MPDNKSTPFEESAQTKNAVLPNGEFAQAGHEKEHEIVKPPCSEAKTVEEEPPKSYGTRPPDSQGDKNLQDLIEIVNQNSELAMEEAHEAVALANSARLKAESAREKAEKARNSAEETRNIAEFSRNMSEKERETSESLKQEALKAKEITELALEEANNAKHKAELVEERYKLVLEGSNDGLWDWDIKKGTVYWNGRFFRMLGIQAAGTDLNQAKTLFELVHPEDQQRLLDTINCTLKSREHFEEMFRVRDSAGKYADYCIRGKTIIDEAGHPIRMAGTITNITDRIQLQENLKLAMGEAELANHRKTQALAHMSHELKTPLNAIMGYSELLLKGAGGDLTEKQRRYIQNVTISGQHMLEMVNDILDITKIEAGKIQITLEWIDINTFMNDIKTMIQESAAQKHLTLIFDIQKGLNGITADPARLRQVLINLLSNAVKFNRKGGQVQLQLSKSEDQHWLICKVIDTGIGIPKAKINSLFTEFYQVDTSTAGQQKGAGLGLALTKRLIELQGGTISVESEENKGTAFTFTLPLSPQEKH